MSAKHSPGPWRWIGSDDEDGCDSLLDSAGRPVLDLGVSDEDSRLIAAAPAMASLLRRWNENPRSFDPTAAAELLSLIDGDE